MVWFVVCWFYKWNVLYNFECLLFWNYKDIYYFMLIGCFCLWILNGFDGEFISRNKLEFLICLNVNNVSIDCK